VGSVDIIGDVGIATAVVRGEDVRSVETVASCVSGETRLVAAVETISMWVAHLRAGALVLGSGVVDEWVVGTAVGWSDDISLVVAGTLLR